MENTLKEMRYKDEKPEETVRKLKEILRENKIEVEEDWTKKSSVGTYSLRLTIKDTNIGQNGKGMTKDFALASAYAEFFERYQNGILIFRQEKPTEELLFIYSADEKALTVQELAKGRNAFLDIIIKDDKNMCLVGEKKEAYLEELLGENSRILEPKNKHISLPYYSVKNKEIVYIPHVLVCHLCGTNGLCAGNTPEEALIEGISEILERHVSMRIIYDRVSLPEIPKQYITKYPKVNDMLEKLEENQGYVYKLLDCSFGGKYPVAGLFVLQKNTGRFGFKLGAHPDYGIAMERCFTEAAQGMDIFEYANGCLFDFKNEDLDKDENIREFVNSTVATIPYQVFSESKKTYEFKAVEDISNLNNKQILQKLVNQILDEGYDILVRDVSTFGFPSFRIIIPGMTELTHSPMGGRFKGFEEIEYLLKDLHRITIQNIDKVIKIMESQINEVGYQNLYTFVNIKDTNILPCEHIGRGAKYFLAMCYIMNQEYEKAEEILEEIIYIAESMVENESEKIFIKAVYYYASAMNKIKNHEEVMEYINLLFDEDIAMVINEIFEKREEILIRHYAFEEQDYVDNDDSYYLPYMETLRKKQKENIIDQIKNKEIFEKA